MTYIKSGILVLLALHLSSNIKAQKDRGILSHSEVLELSEQQEEAIWDMAYEHRMKHQQKVHSREGGRKRIVGFNNRVDSILTEDQIIKWQQIKEEKRVANRSEQEAKHKDFLEVRKIYFDKEMRPVLTPLRRAFDEKLSIEELAIIEKARIQKSEHAEPATPLTKKKRNRGVYHKELSKIVFDHQSELDLIWDSISEDISKWQSDIAELRPSDNSTDVPVNKRRHKTKMDRRRGLSQLGFLLL